MKLYTKKGDRGETELAGGGWLLKDHHRVAAGGEIDELNAAIGMAAAACADESLSGQLRQLQRHLLVIGSELAAGDPETLPRRIMDDDVLMLEAWIDAASDEAGPLSSFIMPGGTEVAARLHQARAVCRRAERGVVKLSRALGVEPSVIAYTNRLSDLLFAMARVANKRGGVEDVTPSGQ